MPVIWTLVVLGVSGVPRSWPRWVVFGLMLLGLSHPAVLTVTRDGNYKSVVRWCDQNLSPGALVVCDRSLTAWSILYANNPRRVQFSGTVPNETSQEYEENRWRSHTRTFLRTNAGSALLEEGHQSAKRGSWSWPGDWFPRQQVFRDERLVVHRRVGPRYRQSRLREGDEDATLILHYDTIEDQLDRARADDQWILPRFTDGWEHAKTPDFRDWRVMTDEALFELHNVTTNPLTITLSIGASGSEGDKSLLVHGQPCVFAQDQMGIAEIGPMVLPPGKTEVAFADTTYRSGEPSLFVYRVNVIIME